MKKKDAHTRLNKRAGLARRAVNAGLVRHEGDVYRVPSWDGPAGTHHDVRLRKTGTERTVRVTCAEVNPLGQGRCPGNRYNGTVCKHVLAGLIAHYPTHRLRFYSTRAGAEKYGDPIRVFSGDGAGQVWIVGKKKRGGKNHESH